MANKKGKDKFSPKLSFPLMGMLYEKMREYATWYAGEIDLLHEYYNLTSTYNTFNTQYQLKRNTFWAKQRESGMTSPIHVPIASSIAELNADLLFGEAPAVRINKAHEEDTKEEYKASQDELDNLLKECDFNQTCLSGSETCSPLGGVYLKISVDEELVKRPILQIEQPDYAIPTFRFGILTEVTFFNTVCVERAKTSDMKINKIHRLAETYTSNGEILYDLYLGSTDKLGERVSITSLPQTKMLKDLKYNYNGILCVYVPNMLPNRLDRNSSMGRSDLQGLEPLMSALDETYSSWLRDIELSKAKILAPSTYLEESTDIDGDLTTRASLEYDKDRAIYGLLNIDPLNADKNTIMMIQFAIRADEFEKSCLNFIERIVSGAGYSPQSFGLNIQGRVESGNALQQRESRSNKKKVKKEAFWMKPLTQLVEAMIGINNEKFGGTIKDDSDITIEFSDGITSSVKEISEAVAKIRTASAASTETLVKMIHRDWTEEQVKAEVERIQKEKEAENLTLEDPDMEEQIDRMNQEKNKNSEE